MTSDGDSNRVRAAYDYYTVMTDNKQPTMHRVELTITRVLRRGQERFPLIPLTPTTLWERGGLCALAASPRPTAARGSFSL